MYVYIHTHTRAPKARGWAVRSQARLLFVVVVWASWAWRCSKIRVFVACRVSDLQGRRSKASEEMHLSLQFSALLAGLAC